MIPTAAIAYMILAALCFGAVIFLSFSQSWHDFWIGEDPHPYVHRADIEAAACIADFDRWESEFEPA